MAVSRRDPRQPPRDREHPQELVARGIKPQASKHAALFQLAAELPHPILADVLGISSTSAARWSALSSRTWGQYTGARRESILQDPE